MTANGQVNEQTSLALPNGHRKRLDPSEQMGMPDSNEQTYPVYCFTKRVPTLAHLLDIRLRFSQPVWRTSLNNSICSGPLWTTAPNTHLRRYTRHYRKAIASRLDSSISRIAGFSPGCEISEDQV